MFDCTEVMHDQIHWMEDQIQAAANYQGADSRDMEVSPLRLRLGGFDARRLRRDLIGRSNRRLVMRLIRCRERLQVAVVGNTIVEQILDIGMLTQPSEASLAHKRRFSPGA